MIICLILLVAVGLGRYVLSRWKDASVSCRVLKEKKNIVLSIFGSCWFFLPQSIWVISCKFNEKRYELKFNSQSKLSNDHTILTACMFLFRNIYQQLLQPTDIVRSYNQEIQLVKNGPYVLFSRFKLINTLEKVMGQSLQKCRCFLS